MKKIIIFMLIVGLIVLCFLTTDQFTYLGGELDLQFTALLFTTSIAIIVVAFLACISGFVKKHTATSNITPFKEQKDF